MSEREREWDSGLGLGWAGLIFPTVLRCAVCCCVCAVQHVRFNSVVIYRVCGLLRYAVLCYAESGELEAEQNFKHDVAVDIRALNDRQIDKQAD